MVALSKVVENENQAVVYESGSSLIRVFFFAHTRIELDYLSDKEKSTFKNIPGNKQREWFFGRITAKRVVSEMVWRSIGLRLNLKDVSVVPQASGKPCVEYKIGSKSQTVSAVSISHTSSIATACVSNDVSMSLGLDVERVRILSNSTIKSFLTKREYDDLYLYHSDNLDFYVMRYWTLKEAYLKAIGTGLRIHPARIEIVGIDTESSPLIYHEGNLVSATVDWTHINYGSIITLVSLGI